MSFLYNSLFGTAASGLQRDATVLSILAGKLDVAGFGCLLEDGRRLHANILCKMRRRSGDVIEKLHGLWTFVQTSSSVVSIVLSSMCYVERLLLPFFVSMSSSPLGLFACF